MEAISETLKAAIPQQQSSLRDNPQENFNHIIIPDDEKNIICEYALYQERKKRHYENVRAEYWDGIKQSQTYPTHTHGEMALIACDKFRHLNKKSFQLDEDNQKVFDFLCRYFTGDASIEKEGYSLSKGLYFFGDVGRGKTELMKMFQLNHVQSYGLVSCKAITDSFADNGGEEVEKYFTNRRNAVPHKYGQEYSGYCFDDLGTEAPEVLHFGNRKNMMADIILRRYDSKMDYRYTHITTNLTADDVRNRYGSRCSDRMREMFNIISFPHTSKSRR